MQIVFLLTTSFIQSTKVCGLWKPNSHQETLGVIKTSSTRKLSCKALWPAVSWSVWLATLTDLVPLPAAPAMCSSTLRRSSHAAGCMSPYISSVRIGAALISSDKGAGERLITWGKKKQMTTTKSCALQLSCVIYPQWTIHSVKFKKKQQQQKTP